LPGKGRLLSGVRCSTQQLYALQFNSNAIAWCHCKLQVIHAATLKCGPIWKLVYGCWCLVIGKRGGGVAPTWTLPERLGIGGLLAQPRCPSRFALEVSRRWGRARCSGGSAPKVQGGDAGWTLCQPWNPKPVLQMVAIHAMSLQSGSMEAGLSFMCALLERPMWSPRSGYATAPYRASSI